jgi:hypothetical protein
MLLVCRVPFKFDQIILMKTCPRYQNLPPALLPSEQ